MPEDVPAGFWNSVLKGLKGHPEAILAVAMVAAGAGLLAKGIHPLASIGLPFAIYVAYCFRMMWADQHKERLAELDVKKLEQSAGAEAAKRSRNVLRRRTKS